MDPCFEGGETYTKGRYRVIDQQLNVEFQNSMLLKKTIWNPEIDPTAEPEITINRRKTEIREETFMLQNCGGNPYLKDIRDWQKNSGTKQIFPTASQFYQLLKREGIWDQLMGESSKKPGNPIR